MEVTSPETLTTKQLRLSKISELEQRQFVAIAAYDIADRVGEVVVVDGLSFNKMSMVMFVNHSPFVDADFTNVADIEKIWVEKLEDGKKALFVRGKFVASPDGDFYYEQMKNGNIEGISISFKINSARNATKRDKELYGDNARVVYNNASVMEMSLTYKDAPVNPKAKIIAYKSESASLDDLMAKIKLLEDENTHLVESCHEKLNILTERDTQLASVTNDLVKIKDELAATIALHDMSVQDMEVKHKSAMDTKDAEYKAKSEAWEREKCVLTSDKDLYEQTIRKSFADKALHEKEQLEKQYRLQTIKDAQQIAFATLREYGITV